MGALQPGTTLGGRYVLRSLLAVGGMGEVWRGADSELDREVAVKVLKDGAAKNDTFLKRFRNEAKNAAGLRHPNIAQVYDYGELDGTPYLVMELVEGEPLSTILERERTLSERRLVTVLRHTCNGLQAAHDAGVMHRDIKPGNLLVQEYDMVKVTDFGVSRGMDQTTLTATGMVMGTAQYLAPELALGKAATAASDLYAVGIIAYESVVGRRPFTAASAVDIAIAQVNEDVPRLPTTVSPAMAKVIYNLLEKNPRKRIKTAAELERHLASFTFEEPSLDPLELDPAGSVPDAAAGSADDSPSTVAPSEQRPAPARAMPPSIAPKSYRPHPERPPGPR
ncbi:serine/threonine-protein kinase [Demequina aurantiaca]|uniref:serine/threonine-protein kinase n=1 Tax=Demequina aurantiaca TaxID=676200 RepID=UPI00078577DB|nr:serine/threonine-protein kinase [Demequina aurantiaca]